MFMASVKFCQRGGQGKKLDRLKPRVPVKIWAFDLKAVASIHSRGSMKGMLTRMITPWAVSAWARVRPLASRLVDIAGLLAQRQFPLQLLQKLVHGLPGGQVAGVGRRLHLV